MSALHYPPTLIVSSGAPRLAAGRERVPSILRRNGIRTATYTYTYTTAPHDFWLFDPHLQEAVKQITAFLRAVDADQSHKAGKGR